MVTITRRVCASIHPQNGTCRVNARVLMTETKNNVYVQRVFFKFLFVYRKPFSTMFSSITDVISIVWKNNLYFSFFNTFQYMRARQSSDTELSVLLGVWEFPRQAFFLLTSLSNDGRNFVTSRNHCDQMTNILSRQRRLKMFLFFSCQITDC